MLLVDLLRKEVPVGHARGEVDEVLDVAAGRVERVLERAEAMIERGEWVFVRAAGVRHGRELNDHLRLQLVQQPTQRLVVSRILDDDLDPDGAQQVEALVE